MKSAASIRARSTVELFISDIPGVNHRATSSFITGSQQRGKLRCRLHHGHVPLRAEADQAQSPESTEEQPSITPIDATCVG
jgi:hypothetical protein